MKKSQDELRYQMWKRVLSEVRGKHYVSDINLAYFAAINKCTTVNEFDDTLDTIMENEKNRVK